MMKYQETPILDQISIITSLIPNGRNENMIIDYIGSGGVTNAID